MEGATMTKNQLESTIKTWLEKNLDKVEIDNSIHLHVDDIARYTGKNVDSPFQDILDPYLFLIGLLKGRLAELMPTLCIPLKSSANLDVRIPKMEGLEAQMSAEPPSIYVISRRSCSLLYCEESYICPIDFQPFDPPREDIYFYYKVCIREYERAQGEEYQRTIFGEQYPDSLSHSWKRIKAFALGES